MLDEHGKVFAALGTTQDITLQRKLETDLRKRNEELGASEAAKAALIERLRYSIDELSNPILEVWDDVLAMPIIGVVDSRRTADMVQRLLGEVSLVDIGVDFGRLTTLRNLEHGLREAIRSARRDLDGGRDVDLDDGAEDDARSRRRTR